MSSDQAFPVGSSLEAQLAFVRDEARRIVAGEYGNEVALLDAALRIEYTLQGVQWTQRRYENFTLSESEFNAIHSFLENRWRVSGQETTRAVTTAAASLVDVGLSNEWPRS
jgi:hypothetical protein